MATTKEPKSKFTIHTGSDNQRLYPREVERLEQIISNIPGPFGGLYDFLVNRRIVTKEEKVVNKVIVSPREFEDVTFRIRARNQPEALRIADEQKFNREVGAGIRHGVVRD